MQVTSFENQDIMKNMIFPIDTTTRFFKALGFTVFSSFDFIYKQVLHH